MTEPTETPVRERVERLVHDVNHGAIIGYDGPGYSSTRMGAEASREIARLLTAALSIAGEKADDPELDGTDFAHPAWWRGNDAGVASTIQIVNEILDGRHMGKFGDASLQALYERLKAGEKAGVVKPDYDAIMSAAIVAADAEYAIGPDETAFQRAIKAAVEWSFMALSPAPVAGAKFCQCVNSKTDPCIVCGKPKTLVSAGWIKKMAAKEGDLDATTGRPAPHFEPVLNGPELWEIVYGAIEGDVPEEFTDEVFQKIADAINEAFPRAEYLLDPANIYADRPDPYAPVAADELVGAHPDDIAVDRFASAMKAKLAEKRAQGYGGWDRPDECTIAFLSELLRKHVGKGDPVDVGNFAMMIHQRGGIIE